MLTFTAQSWENLHECCVVFVGSITDWHGSPGSRLSDLVAFLIRKTGNKLVEEWYGLALQIGSITPNPGISDPTPKYLWLSALSSDECFKSSLLIRMTTPTTSLIRILLRLHSLRVQAQSTKITIERYATCRLHRKSPTAYRHTVPWISFWAAGVTSLSPPV